MEGCVNTSEPSERFLKFALLVVTVISNTAVLFSAELQEDVKSSIKDCFKIKPHKIAG